MKHRTYFVLVGVFMFSLVSRSSADLTNFLFDAEDLPTGLKTVRVSPEARPPLTENPQLIRNPKGIGQLLSMMFQGQHDISAIRSIVFAVYKAQGDIGLLGIEFKTAKDLAKFKKSQNRVLLTDSRKTVLVSEERLAMVWRSEKEADEQLFDRFVDLVRQHMKPKDKQKQ